MREAESVEYVSGGQRIRGRFYTPTPQTAAGAILICPGFTGTRAGGPYRRYIDRFVDIGYAVLHADYRGWGESEGLRHNLDPLGQIEDLQAGLTYLETRAETPADRLALFGTSFGGGHAVYLAGLDSRVRAAVAVSAIADGEQWLRSMRNEADWLDFLDSVAAERKRAVLGEAPVLVDPNTQIQISTAERTAFAQDQAQPKQVLRSPFACAQLIMQYAPRRLAAEASRVLFVYVEDDQVVPSDHTMTLFAAAQHPTQLVSLRGTGHYAAYADRFGEIAEASEAWFAAHLA